MSYRPETFTIKGLQDSLASAPRRLLLICVCQILLLCCGVFVGHGSAECEVRLPQGSAIEGKNNTSVAVALLCVGWSIDNCLLIHTVLCQWH